MNTTTAIEREQLFGMDARRNDEGEGNWSCLGLYPPSRRRTGSRTVSAQAEGRAIHAPSAAAVWLSISGTARSTPGDQPAARGRLYDLAQRRMDPVLAPGEVGDPLAVGHCLDQRGGGGARPDGARIWAPSRVPVSGSA